MKKIKNAFWGLNSFFDDLLAVRTALIKFIRRKSFCVKFRISEDTRVGLPTYDLAFQLDFQDNLSPSQWKLGHCHLDASLLYFKWKFLLVSFSFLLKGFYQYYSWGSLKGNFFFSEENKTLSNKSFIMRICSLALAGTAWSFQNTLLNVLVYSKWAIIKCELSRRREMLCLMSKTVFQLWGKSLLAKVAWVLEIFIVLIVASESL